MQGPSTQYDEVEDCLAKAKASGACAVDTFLGVTGIQIQLTTRLRAPDWTDSHYCTCNKSPWASQDLASSRSGSAPPTAPPVYVCDAPDAGGSSANQCQCDEYRNGASASDAFVCHKIYLEACTYGSQLCHKCLPPSKSHLLSIP